MLGDGVLRLLFCADEQDRPVALGDVAREGMRLVEQLRGLLQVDDVDAAALRENEAAHLGVPATRLVAEMNSGLQQVAHGDYGHGSSLWLECAAPVGSGGTGTKPAPAARIESTGSSGRGQAQV